MFYLLVLPRVPTKYSKQREPVSTYNNTDLIRLFFKTLIRYRSGSCVRISTNLPRVQTEGVMSFFYLLSSKHSVNRALT